MLNDEPSFDLVIRSSDCMTDRYFVHARESRLHLATIPDLFNGMAFKLSRISDTISKNPLFHRLKEQSPFGRKLYLLYM